MRYSLPLLFLTAVISISPVINDILQDSIVTSKDRCKKSRIKRSKCPINYYANCCFIQLNSGDVELNPGPGSRIKNNTAKSSIPNKAVGTNRKHVKCEVCQRLTHVSYLNISKIQRETYTVKTIALHTCSAWTLTEVPS